MDKILNYHLYIGIIAHGNIKHLERLIKKLTHPNVTILLHMDSKVPIEQYKHIDVKTISSKCQWGNISLVEAEVNLMKEAYNLATDKWHFVLLSGLDYLMKPIDVIVNYFSKSTSNYINFKTFPIKEWFGGDYRFDYTLFLDDSCFTIPPINSKKIKRCLTEEQWKLVRKNINKLLKPREHPKIIPVGSPFGQFKTLYCDTIELILNHELLDELLKYHKYTFAPDEMLIHTLVNDVSNNIQPSKHFTNVYNDKTKLITSINNIPDVFFIRKIKNILLLNEIDKSWE